LQTAGISDPADAAKRICSERDELRSENHALRERNAELEKMDEELTDSLNRTLQYAREIAGRRDVHSIEEVLDDLKRERDRALSELAEARKALLVLMGQADLSMVKDCSSQVAVMVALFRAHMSQQAKECEAARAAIPENGATEAK